MNVFDKVKWILGIILVFAIVLATNLVDKDNYNSLKNSIVSIYEDRLVANDLILKISDHIHEKEIAYVTSDTAYYRSEIGKTSSELDQLIASYEKTELTQEEGRAFDRLKADLATLKKEQQNSEQFSFDNDQYLEIIQDIKRDLTLLSEVQLKEGKRLKLVSEKNIDSIEFFTQMEIIFLIVMAVVVQIIVLYSPKKSS